jgi:hypothetical protein
MFFVVFFWRSVYAGHTSLQSWITAFTAAAVGARGKADGGELSGNGLQARPRANHTLPHRSACCRTGTRFPR